MVNLQRKVALVTGASRGIGAGIARTLAAHGASIVVNYARNAEAARSVVDAIEHAGGRALALQADVSQLDAHERLIREVERHFGQLDILVNNAALITTAPLLEATPDDFDRQFATNVRGLMFLTQRAVRGMREGGRIVNVSSVAATATPPTYSAYAATKAAVNAFTGVWARELGGRGITVNSISPGPVETDMHWAVQTKESTATLAAMSPFGRLGQPNDIADVVAFLCAHEARWITGREIIVDGGFL